MTSEMELLRKAGNDLADELEQLNDGLSDRVQEQRIKRIIAEWDEVADND